MKALIGILAGLVALLAVLLARALGPEGDFTQALEACVALGLLLGAPLWVGIGIAIEQAAQQRRMDAEGAGVKGTITVDSASFEEGLRQARMRAQEASKARHPGGRAGFYCQVCEREVDGGGSGHGCQCGASLRPVVESDEDERHARKMAEAGVPKSESRFGENLRAGEAPVPFVPRDPAPPLGQPQDSAIVRELKRFHDSPGYPVNGQEWPRPTQEGGVL